MSLFLGKFILIFLVIIYLLYIWPRESFASNTERGQFLYNWFNTERTPSYEKLQNDDPNSDIVDYNKIYNLFEQKNLTLANAINAL